MSDPEQTDQQLALLTTHRRTLHHYLMQRAEFGDEHTPPAVAISISEVRSEIARIKAALRARGVVVDDQENDAEPAELAVVQVQAIEQPHAAASLPRPTHRALLQASLPDGDSVTALRTGYTYTYSVVQAELQRMDARQALLHIVIRATTTYPYSMNFWARDIRLKIADQMLTSSNDPNLVVAQHETKEGSFDFVIPNQPAQASLVFLIGDHPVELLLEIG